MAFRKQSQKGGLMAHLSCYTLLLLVSQGKANLGLFLQQERSCWSHQISYKTVQLHSWQLLHISRVFHSKELRKHMNFFFPLTKTLDLQHLKTHSKPSDTIFTFSKIFLMWTILKVLIEFVTIQLLLFMSYIFGSEGRGILAPWPGIEPTSL